LTIAGALFQKISRDNLAALCTLIIDSTHHYYYTVLLVRCVTEHGYGEGKRGRQTDGREDGERMGRGKHRGQRDGREDSVALYPAGKALSKNRVRTEKQIGEERSREAKEEIIAVFAVYRRLDRAVRGFGGKCRLFVFFRAGKSPTMAYPFCPRGKRFWGEM
jgi:hypothetical protein